MTADDLVAFVQLIGLISPLIFFISINEVKTIPFSRQVAVKILGEVAGDIPRQLIKTKYLLTNLYLATDVSFCVLLTAFICYESVVSY